MDSKEEKKDVKVMSRIDGTCLTPIKLNLPQQVRVKFDGYKILCYEEDIPFSKYE